MTRPQLRREEAVTQQSAVLLVDHVEDLSSPAVLDEQKGDRRSGRHGLRQPP
jgi:hypothetical protein